MPLTLNPGASALAAPRHLHRAQTELATTMARLSSGLRINSARDDAAGLGISLRLGTQAAASRQVTQGVNDGIGLVQTADGALTQVANKLQRARELAVQAASGQLLPSDRAALAQEYAGILQDLDNLATGTAIFGIHPLIGPVAGNTPHVQDVFPSSGATLIGVTSGLKPMAYLPTGARDVVLEIDSLNYDDDIQVFTRDGRHLAGTPLGDSTWTDNAVTTPSEMKSKVFTRENGFQPTATYDASGLLDGSASYTNPASNPPTAGLTGTTNGMTITYSGDGDRHDGTPNNGLVSPGQTGERILIDEVKEPLIVMVAGGGSFNANASWSSMPSRVNQPGVGPTEIVVNAPVHGQVEKVTVQQTPADLVSLGLVGTSLATSSASSSALSALDAALDQVSAHRATLAGVASRLERVADTLGMAREQAQAAQSRIADAAYAAETAALARSRILADSSRAMLAQANSSAEVALSLLRTG